MASSSRPARNRSSKAAAGKARGARPRTGPRMARRSAGSSALNWGIPLVVALGAVLLLLVCCLGLGAGSATTSGTTSQAASAGNASSTQASHAPDFTLALLNGSTFHLAGALGHPVVLYFMAPTCATCAQGSRQLAQVMQTANVAGATALAIDVTPGDRPADLRTFVQSIGQPASTTLQWGIDSTGAIATAYGVQTLETMVVINAQGQIEAFSGSPIAPAQLITLIKSAG
jgi:peroxiredoxin